MTEAAGYVYITSLLEYGFEAKTKNSVLLLLSLRRFVDIYFDFMQTGGGFGTEMKLCIISIGMAQIFVTSEMTKGEKIYGEKESKHRLFGQLWLTGAGMFCWGSTTKTRRVQYQ